MKVKFGFAILLPALMIATACSKDEDPAPEAPKLTLTKQKAADLDGNVAKTANFRFYDLKTGQFVAVDAADSATNKWDIAFNATTIIFNSGVSGPGNASAQIVQGTFNEIYEAPVNGYKQDIAGNFAIPTGSDNGWYHYTFLDNPQHAMLPIPGKINVMRMTDGKYAKLEILSYYKGNPDTSTPEFANLMTRPAERYYTINYVVQMNGTRKF